MSVHAVPCNIDFLKFDCFSLMERDTTMQREQTAGFLMYKGEVIESTQIMAGGVSFWFRFNLPLSLEYAMRLKNYTALSFPFTFCDSAAFIVKNYRPIYIRMCNGKYTYNDIVDSKKISHRDAQDLKFKIS